MGAVNLKKFEYRLEHIEVDIKNALGKEALAQTHELMEKLDEIGKEGWRLCGVNGFLYYFSRELHK